MLLFVWGFFFNSIEGPWIHQSGIAAVPGRQFRVRVLYTPHHRVPVHREPEQQLHITSSLSGAPHQQPQRAVVEFQWMVRVNAFERATVPPSPQKKDWNLKKERELLGLFSKSAVKHGLGERREARKIDYKGECMDRKRSEDTEFNFSPLLYFPFLLRDFLERYLQKSMLISGPEFLLYIWGFHQFPGREGKM